MSGPAAALSTEGLVAGYEPDLPIVKDVDFSLRAGELVAILGPNGAGKSTYVKAIAGLVPVHRGRVRLGADEITRAPAHRLVRSGLAFVPQTENIFATLSIHENLQLCAGVLPAGRRRERMEAVYALFPDLGSRRSMAAGGLSGGQRQMLATARGLLVDPSVLILDEPSAGLSPKLAHEVFATLVRIRETGVSILLVEQNVRAALRIADRAVVLVDGRIRHEGPAAELSDDGRLGEMFLGAGGEGQAP